MKAIGGQLDKLSVQGGEGRAWGLDAFQGEQRTCMWGEAAEGLGWQDGPGSQAPPVSRDSQKQSPQGGEDLKSLVQGNKSGVSGGECGWGAGGLNPVEATDLEDGAGVVCEARGPSWALPLEGTMRPRCGLHSPAKLMKQDISQA